MMKFNRNHTMTRFQIERDIFLITAHILQGNVGQGQCVMTRFKLLAWKERSFSTSKSEENLEQEPLFIFAFNLLLWVILTTVIFIFFNMGKD